MAAATEPSAHVVIVGRANSPLVRRLCEESEALGFTVDSKDEALGPLASELTTPDVVAAIRVLEQPEQALELAIRDPQLHQLIHEELPIRATTDPTATELVTTRAIELLRAIRLQIPSAPAPPQPAAPPPRTRTEAPTKPPPKPTTAVSVSPLLSYAPELKPGLSADLQASFVPHYLGVSAGIVLPISAQRLEYSGGEIMASVIAVHAALVVETNPRGPFGLRVGVGLEASRVQFEGRASAPLVNAASTAFTYGPECELAAALRLAPHVRLLVPASASYALPRTVIRSAGQPLQDFGPLVMRVGVGAQWYWP